MAEAAFSEDGKYYSAISQDGRLRIWDTETNVLKQEYTPDLHLTAPPSCLQWITIATSKSPVKKDKWKSSVTEHRQEEVQCIAVGTTSGKILIYSVAQAKVQTVLEVQLGKAQEQKITSLDWNRRDGLFSCNKSNYICEWKLGKGQNNNYHVNMDNRNKPVSTISAIKLIPHSQDTSAKYIITASWQLRLWRLHDGQATTIKCLGHNASKQSLLAIVATSEKTWVIEGSQTERLLAFWDVTVTSDVAPQTNGTDEDITPNKKKKRKSISYSEKEIKTENIPTYNFVLEDAPRMIDVEVKEKSDVKLTLAAVTRSGVVHYYSHTLNGASTKPIKPNLTVHITTGEATPLPLQCSRLLPSSLQVGYMQGPTLIFEKITPDLSSKTQVLIRGETKKTKIKGSTPNEINKVATTSTKDAQYLEPMGGVTRKRLTPGGKVEVPMERRLANLALDTAARDRTAVNQNLTRLLMQGLQSKDTNILEMVLHDSGRAAAARTAAQLPAEFVPPLLDHLAALATKHTATCATVCVWVSGVLRAHAALLLATMPAHSAERLASLLAAFTNRRAHLCQLLNVSGRLQLTLAQRAEKQTAPAEEPVIDYNDTSDEEMEVERQSASDASWDEQDFDDDDSEEERPRRRRGAPRGGGGDSDHSGGE